MIILFLSFFFFSWGFIHRFFFLSPPLLSSKFLFFFWCGAPIVRPTFFHFLFIHFLFFPLPLGGPFFQFMFCSALLRSFFHFFSFMFCSIFAHLFHILFSSIFVSARVCLVSFSSSFCSFRFARIQFFCCRVVVLLYSFFWVQVRFCVALVLYFRLACVLLKLSEPSDPREIRMLRASNLEIRHQIEALPCDNSIFTASIIATRFDAIPSTWRR